MPDPPADSPRRGPRALRLVAALAAALFAALLIARASAAAARAELEERAAAKLTEIEALEESGDVAEADRVAAAAWDLVADESSFEGATEELAFRALAARLQAADSPEGISEVSHELLRFSDSSSRSLRSMLLWIALHERFQPEQPPATIAEDDWTRTFEAIETLAAGDEEPRFPNDAPDRRAIGRVLRTQLGSLIHRDDHVLRPAIDVLVARYASEDGLALPARWTTGTPEELAHSLAGALERGCNVRSVVELCADRRTALAAPPLGGPTGGASARLLGLASDPLISDDDFWGVTFAHAFVMQSPRVWVRQAQGADASETTPHRPSMIEWMELVEETASSSRGERTLARAISALDAVIAAQAAGLEAPAFTRSEWYSMRLGLVDPNWTDLPELRARLARRSAAEHIAAKLGDVAPDALELSVEELVERLGELGRRQWTAGSMLHQLAAIRADEAGRPYPDAPLRPHWSPSFPSKSMHASWSTILRGEPEREATIDVVVLRWSAEGARPRIVDRATVRANTVRRAHLELRIPPGSRRHTSAIPWALAPVEDPGPEHAEFDLDALVADAEGGVQAIATARVPRWDSGSSMPDRSLRSSTSVNAIAPGSAAVLDIGSVVGARDRRDMWCAVGRVRVGDEDAPGDLEAWLHGLTAGLRDLVAEFEATDTRQFKMNPVRPISGPPARSVWTAALLARSGVSAPPELGSLLGHEFLSPFAVRPAIRFSDPWNGAGRGAVQGSESSLRVGAAFAVLVAVLVRGRRWFVLSVLVLVGAWLAGWALNGAAPGGSDARWIAVTALAGAGLARHARGAGLRPVGGALIAAAIAAEAAGAHGVAPVWTRAASALLFLGGVADHAAQGEQRARADERLRGGGVAWLVGLFALPAVVGHLLVALGGDAGAVARSMPGLGNEVRPALLAVFLAWAAVGMWLVENLRARESEPLGEGARADA